MKGWILVLMLILVSSFVSAELAYEFRIEKIGPTNNDIRLVSQNIVDVPPEDIYRAVIGSHLLVAGNETSDYEYLDGMFFTLPELTFVTYVDENDQLYTETEESNITTVRIPFNDEITVFRVFLDDGSMALEFEPQEDLMDTLGVEDTIDVEQIMQEQESVNSNTESISASKLFWARTIAIIALIIIVLIFLLFRVKKHKQ